MLFRVDLGCRKTFIVWPRIAVNISANIGVAESSLQVKTDWEVVPGEQSIFSVQRVVFHINFFCSEIANFFFVWVLIRYVGNGGW